MITLKFAMIVMIAGTSMLPMHTENMHTPVIYPKPQIEIVNELILPAVPKEKKESIMINQHKTYEQCMKEAFERVYEEVNRLLDQIPEEYGNRF